MISTVGAFFYRFSRSVEGTTPDMDASLDGEYYLLFGVGNKLQNDSKSRSSTNVHLFTGHFFHHCTQLSMEDLHTTSEHLKSVQR